MLLAACGARCHGRVLELGCGSGASTAALAARSLRLDAVDASASALAAAEHLLAACPNVCLHRAILPHGMPRGPYDLIVVSELAYYLTRRDHDLLCDRIGRALAPGGRLVLLHHHRPFHDATQRPGSVHRRMLSRLGPARFRCVRTVRTERWACLALGHRRSHH